MELPPSLFELLSGDLPLSLPAELLDLSVAAGDLFVQFALVVVVVGQRSVDLRQGQMRMFRVDLGRRQSKSLLIQHHLNDLGGRVGDPGGALLIYKDMGDGHNGHRLNSSSVRSMFTV